MRPLHPVHPGQPTLAEHHNSLIRAMEELGRATPYGGGGPRGRRRDGLTPARNCSGEILSAGDTVGVAGCALDWGAGDVVLDVVTPRESDAGRFAVVHDRMGPDDVGAVCIQGLCQARMVRPDEAPAFVDCVAGERALVAASSGARIIDYDSASTEDVVWALIQIGAGSGGGSTVEVKNGSGAEVPAHGVMQVWSIDESFVHTIGPPSSTNIRTILVNDDTPLPSGETKSIDTSWPKLCAVHGGTPTVGSPLGAVAGQWTLGVGYYGFACNGWSSVLGLASVIPAYTLAPMLYVAQGDPTSGGYIDVAPYGGGQTITVKVIP